MTVINLDNRVTYPLDAQIPGAKVWTRNAWADAWTERSDLFPVESVWTVGRSKAAATLWHPYGSVQLPGQSTHSTIARITTRGYFVLIEWQTDDGDPLYWIGYAESPIDGNHHPARDLLPEAGEQTIPCIGMIGALQQNWITSTVHEDPGTPGNDPPRRFGGAVFNPNDKGNRNDTKKSLNGGHSAYVFQNPETDGEFWSSRDIVEHLIAFHLPTPDQTFGDIPWSIPDASAIPDWDRPTVETDGRSVADIIAELLSPKRLLNFAVGATATAGSPPTINSLTIEPFTHLVTALTLPAFGSVPANTNTVSITANVDPRTSKPNVTEDESDVVDQVVVRGPREIGVATWRHDSEFVKDWDTPSQTSYVNDPTTATGWASMLPFEKRERNDTVRSRPKFRKVFRTFKVKGDWDGTADGDPVFVQDGGTYIPYLGNVELLDRLPLYEEIDYSGAATAVDESTGRVLLKNIFALENPDTALLDDFERLGNLKAGFDARNGQGIPISLSGTVDNREGPRIHIDVSGAPQHSIAGSSFIGNDGDVRQSHFGGHDYTTLVTTLAMRNDRRPYWALPASVTADVVRRRIETIEHPSLQLVNMAAATIVDFDENGDEITSDGGVLRDPTDLIKSIATMLAEHYTKPRRRAEIVTGWRLSAIQVGAMLTTLSTHPTTINAPIVEVKVTAPIGRGSAVEQPGDAVMTITAATDSYDVMSLLIPVDEDLLEAPA